MYNYHVVFDFVLCALCLCQCCARSLHVEPATMFILQLEYWAVKRHRKTVFSMFVDRRLRQAWHCDSNISFFFFSFFFLLIFTVALSFQFGWHLAKIWCSCIEVARTFIRWESIVSASIECLCMRLRVELLIVKHDSAFSSRTSINCFLIIFTMRMSLQRAANYPSMRCDFHLTELRLHCVENQMPFLCK